MRRIEKKTWPEWYQAIADGKKTYDLRLADFEAEPGDVIVFREWDPETKTYTGCTMEKVVTYIGHTKGCERWWPQEDIDRYGFQIISFR